MNAIVVGKFYPPHNGHHYLIETALAGSDSVEVLVVDNSRYKIPVSKRKQWLEENHPTAKITVIPDIYKDDDSQAWADHTLAFLGYKPDVVFSSESYGITWAECMGCEHVMVDVDRNTIPISATKVRSSLTKYWPYLSPSVKRDLAIRIVVIGAESTGTTTLSKALAKKMKTPWVPEIGRYYTESLISMDYKWQDEDFYTIGALQNKYEQKMAQKSNGMIVCDTNAHTTELWQRRYVGKTTDEMRTIGAQNPADLYIITGHEIPFIQDGIRDGEHLRREMHDWCVEQAKRTAKPYFVARGTLEKRVEESLAFINNNLDEIVRIA